MGHALGKVAEIIAAHWASTTFDEIQALLQGGGCDFREAIARQLTPIFATSDDDSHRAQRALWEKYYREHFGMTVDLSQIRVPAKPTVGKWRLLAIAGGLTMNHAAECYHTVIRAHDARWTLWQYAPDFDAVVTRNERTSAVSYFVWVRDGVEPDAEYLGKAAHDADPELLIGETLLERLVHGAIHLVETKKHLDEKGWTQCTGSRPADGSVPCVYADSGRREVRVGWCGVRDADPRGGLRQVVS